eukprot:TRINITY_DN16726_c0_g1_i2.p1 TRINITY_DN16726_c0_g1~~TRINITY_DN16726_c0_g1_i2.p1  ORF type:complete len:335 (+),score=47.81 TRINITY_DN16726_c0_g1_i2:134-1138(+)
MTLEIHASSRRSRRAVRTARRVVAASYRIEEVAGKGLGVIATRDIRNGERVLAETPMLTFKDEENWQADVQRQFSSLSPSEQDAIMSLEDVHRIRGQKSVPGIVSTNSIGVTSTYCGVVCPRLSRFNHSCNPNCEQVWDWNVGEEQLFTCKDIAAGEELTITYLDPLAVRAERVEDLLSTYKFQCDCPSCQAVDSNKSDKRLLRLKELLSVIAQGPNKDADAALEIAREMLRLFDEEAVGLNAYRTNVCYYVFQNLLLAGRKDEAQPWIDDAYRYLKMCRSPDHEELLNLEGYKANLDSHPAASGGTSPLTTALAIGGAGLAVGGALYIYTHPL